MKNRRNNLYAVGKAILSCGMTVNEWWAKPYDLDELKRAFGLQALQNGVLFALEHGNPVPDKAMEIMPDGEALARLKREFDEAWGLNK